MKFDYILVAQDAMKVNNEFIFFIGEISSLEIGSEVVNPS